MQTSNVKNEAKNDGIETLEGVAYELRPCNAYRWRLRAGGRARLFVSEMLAYVPDGEFEFAEHGTRYRLKLDGPLARTLVYTELRNYENAERQRERWFRPVRILALEKIPPKVREYVPLSPERPIAVEERELVARLLPAEFPGRERVLKAGTRATVWSRGDGLLTLNWPGTSPVGGRITEISLAATNAAGVAVRVELTISRGVPSALRCRLSGQAGFSAFPPADSLPKGVLPVSVLA